MQYTSPMYRRAFLATPLLLTPPLHAATPGTPADPTSLDTLLGAIATGSDNLHGVVVERAGVVLGECYRDGPDRLTTALWSTPTRFDADTLHDVRSISKSVVSLLWGIAQARGLVPPLDTPALDLLPALADLRRDGREAITLAHLFDMTSGLAWMAFTGLRLRPRDLARLGRLVLGQGRWQGREVVPSAWLAESLQPRVDVPPLGPVLTGLRYGRFWWHGQMPDPRPAHRDSPLSWTAGFGNGGQRLYLVPALDLVVAVSAGAYGEPAVNAPVDRLLRDVVDSVSG